MQLDKFDRNRLVMFLSADVVGSTEFKASAQSDTGPDSWLGAFETLFRELPLIFIGQLGFQFLEEDDLPESGVWKVMGDEVVFAVLPQSLAQAQLITAAFVSAVASYDQRISDRWPLRIRGCCWGAEIGARNRAIEIPEMLGGSADRPYLDFLGPDIDIGFRLSAHSRPGGVILSPNLAESFAGQDDQRDLRFHYIGEAPLKGVCAGQPFPFVLVSLESAGVTEFDTMAAPELADKLAQMRIRMRDEHGAFPAPPVHFGEL